ncbi:MAG: MBL fold metallo-hydrolase [Candidatus Zixiibacteriota bacterium]|nr:MAG: MBL fold metallo-hydrolase [candidate division Zixibacteria bacterium]
MSRFLIPVITAILLLACGPSVQDESPFKVVKLTEKIYQLSTDEGEYTTNVLVFTGDDGLLLVDTNAEQYAGELKKQIESFGKGKPKYIINTHRHVEHIGGNAVFGPEPVVIGHDLIRTRLRSGSYLFDEYPEITLPDIGLTDSLYLYFNGEKIRLIPLVGSHDDNEIIVHFTGSRVVHLSSLVNGLNFPSVDSDGDVLKFEETVSKAIDLLPDDVIIVSGHNNNCTRADLFDYVDMLHQTTAIVREGLAAGKTVEQMQEEKVLAGFEKYAQSYVSPEGWIEYLARGIKGEKKKKTIYEPLYYAYKESGIEAAIEKYGTLKEKFPDEYNFNEAALVIIGSKLQVKSKYTDSVKMLELCLDEYPGGDYLYYTHYLISKSLKETGEIEKAITHCEKSLEANPEFQGASSLLEELKKM